MYLLPAGTLARSKTKWGGLGLIPAMVDRSSYQYYTNGGSTPYNPFVTPPKAIVPTKTAPIVPVVEKPTPIVYVPPPISRPVSYPIFPGPPVRAPLPILPKPPITITAPSPANTGTPVPGGFPTNQFFVASDGSVWEFGNGKWFNTGTPYSAPGASSAVPAPIASSPAASGSGSASSSSPSAPVNVSVTSDSGYQTILDWLPQKTLLSVLPNWAVLGGAGLLAWKLFGKGGR